MTLQERNRSARLPHRRPNRATTHTISASLQGHLQGPSRLRLRHLHLRRRPSLNIANIPSLKRRPHLPGQPSSMPLRGLLTIRAGIASDSRMPQEQRPLEASLDSGLGSKHPKCPHDHPVLIRLLRDPNPQRCQTVQTRDSQACLERPAREGTLTQTKCRMCLALPTRTSVLLDLLKLSSQRIIGVVSLHPKLVPRVVLCVTQSHQSQPIVLNGPGFLKDSNRDMPQLLARERTSIQV